MIDTAVGGPPFDVAVARGGYTWWYLDALSDDERYTVVVIAMVGNPFSPFYASARLRNAGNPLDFVAMNVVIYGPARSCWALTERRNPARAASSLAIGPSAIRWDGATWIIDIDEVTAPIPRRLKGRIVVHPELAGGGPRALDGRGAHQWWAIAPRARVEVHFTDPSVRFSGAGYLDANAGVEPLEDAFSSWSWSRVATQRGAAVSYDVRLRDGSSRAFDLTFDPDRGSVDVGGWVSRKLPFTRWGVARSSRASASCAMRLVKTLEDTPFYARSQIGFSTDGKQVIGVHESLSLDRFRSRWVRFLLPMRMRIGV